MLTYSVSEGADSVFPPDWGMLEGLDAFRFFFNSTGGIIMCPQVVFYITPTGPCVIILQNNCSTCHLPQKHTMYQCKTKTF